MEKERNSVQDENDLSLVVFSEEFYPSTSGGAHTRWLFSNNAVQRGVDVTVFTFRDPGTSHSESVDGVKIRRPVPSLASIFPPDKNLSVPIRVFSSIIMLFYLLFWFYNKQVDTLYSASHVFHWVAKILGIIYHIPVINLIDYTPSLDDNGGSIRQLFEQTNFRLFMGETIYCRTPSIKNSLQSAGNDDARILHGVLHSERFEQLQNTGDVRSKYSIPENSILIAFVGRLVPIKQPELVIQTIADLPTEFQLIVVGNGRKKQDLIKQVEINNLESRVTFTGELPHVEALEIMLESDILQLTSKTESYGAVAFEALAVGSSVVVPPIGVFPSVNHNRLHVAPVKDHINIIPNVGRSSQRVHKDIVQEYSMNRYTEEILERIRELYHR